MSDDDVMYVRMITQLDLEKYQILVDCARHMFYQHIIFFILPTYGSEKYIFLLDLKVLKVGRYIYAQCFN